MNKEPPHHSNTPVAPDLNYGALFDSLNAAAMILDRRGQVLQMNRTARALCAPSPGATPIGRTLCEAAWWNSSSDRTAVRHAVERVIARVGNGAVEARVRRVESDVRILAMTLRLLPDTSGTESLILVEATDITSQRESEAALHAALAQQRSVLDCILHPLVIIDASGIIQSCSRAVTRVFGYEASELIGRNVSILMPEPHRSAHDGYLAAYRRTGQTNIINRPREFEAVRKDGSTVVIELNVTRADIPGRPLPLFAGLMRDLTAEKRATAELRERDRRIRRMLETPTMVAVILDAAGRITFTNEALLDLTGWKRHEVIGEDWFTRFIPPEDRDHVRGLLSEAMHAGHIITPHENHILTRSGATRLIRWHNTVLDAPDETTVMGVTAIGVDITEQRRIEAELEAHRERLEEMVQERTAELELTHDRLRAADRLAAMGTLAAGLGHDMGNIVFPAICRLDVVDAQTTDRQLREELKEIRASLEYLRRLADGLHLLAMNPDGDADADGAVDVATWWEEVQPLILRAARRRSALTTSIPAGLGLIAVSSHRLTQAVFNLVVNAADATNPDGHIWLSARANEAGTIEICVRDDGPGMTEEVRKRALDPFFTTKKRGLGTGLGLSLTQAAVRAAGGAIEIQSQPGEGTTVTLTFVPVAQAPRPSPAQAIVSIADPRGRAFVTSLLRAAGVNVSQESPGDALTTQNAIWVADATPESIEAASAYLAESPDHRRVILIGPTSPTPPLPADAPHAPLPPHSLPPLPPGAAFVGTMSDIDHLRQALSKAINAG